MAWPVPLTFAAQPVFLLTIQALAGPVHFDDFKAAGFSLHFQNQTFCSLWYEITRHKND